jgi:hypothetical protein
VTGSLLNSLILAVNQLGNGVVGESGPAEAGQEANNAARRRQETRGGMLDAERSAAMSIRTLTVWRCPELRERFHCCREGDLVGKVLRGDDLRQHLLSEVPGRGHGDACPAHGRTRNSERFAREFLLNCAVRTEQLNCDSSDSGLVHLLGWPQAALVDDLPALLARRQRQPGKEQVMLKFL